METINIVNEDGLLGLSLFTTNIVFEIRHKAREDMDFINPSLK